jgi:uncharacterized membrane protein
MKLPDLYHDWRVVLGFALIVLGAGNWVVGRARTQEYADLIAHESQLGPDKAYRSFDELDSSANAVLEPFTSEQRNVSYATARMDFYHATFLTGQALVLVGLIITFIGFIAVIKSDTRRVIRRLAAGVGGNAPPTS